MACLGRSAAPLHPHMRCASAAVAVTARAGGTRGSRRRAGAAAGPSGSGLVAGFGRLNGQLQPRSASAAVKAQAAAAGDSTAAAPRKRRGRQPSSVPDVDAEQLLRSLSLGGAANPDALLTNLRKLAGVRQQGVLDNAAAVAAHLLSPAVGLTVQQAGQLLERCPYLFSWPTEQRAAVLFGDLLGAGLTAAAAARCLCAYPAAASLTKLAPGLSDLAAILAHSANRDSSRSRQPVPPAQRTVAALCTHTPSAVQLVCQRTGYLQQRAAELQQAGFSAAEVAALAWEQPPLLWVRGAARLADVAAVLQQELGVAAAEVDSFVVSNPPRWLSAGRETVRARAAALAEAFGREAIAAALLKWPDLLSCPPAVWRRNMCYIAACGVADPKAVLLQSPPLFVYDHGALGFLQRRLLLQHAFQLTATQLYGQQAYCIARREPLELAQRLQFVEQRGQAHRLVAKAKGGRKPAAASAEERRPVLSMVAVTGSSEQFLSALGASQAEWEAWAAANPPEACPLHRWAKQAAAEEAALLAGTLPPELRLAAEADGAAGAELAT